MKSLRTIPLIPVTVSLLLLIALLAGSSLWALWRIHQRESHSAATQSVMEMGQLMAAHLANQPSLHQQDGSEDWSTLSQLVRGLAAMETGLEYVSISEDGVTVFHESLSAAGAPLASAETPPRYRPDTARLGKRVLQIGSRSIPVVTFTMSYTNALGTTRTVEVALHRATVSREEQLPSGLTGSMFRMSLITLSLAFGVCIVLVIWMMHRETVRERRRRESEHLAFAGVMASGIVHDFRNPMSSLRLDLQMLEREAARQPPRPERLADLASRAKATVDRMEKIFQEFVFLARPASGTPEPTRLDACLHECVDLISPRLDQRGVRVELRIPTGPIWVAAYPMSLRRALLNVLTNAEQFSPDAGVIVVRLSTTGQTAALEVEDAGPGIPPRDRQRIFDLFVSLRPGGNGLGLFLARSALDKCHGTIHVTDGHGPGACFRIQLPLSLPPRHTGRETAGSPS